MNTLTKSIFKTLYLTEGRNFCFSPASLLEAVNVLALCIKGENLSEILDVLNISEDDLLNYVQNYRSNLKLQSSNYLFYDQKYQFALNASLVNKIRDLGSELRNMGSNVDKIVSEINSLVASRTNNKINNLISREDFSEFTCFIILNCVYFKGDWLYEFSKGNYTDDFTGSENVSKIHYLNKETHFRYYEEENLDIVEIPYKNISVCCYLFIPENLDNFLLDLDENYSKIHKIKTNLQVNLTCPPFKTESFFDLRQAFEICGVKKIWEFNKDWKLVDFNLLLAEAVMAVGKIKQKVYFDFTKEGSEAAAATFVMCYISGCSMSFSIPPKIKFIKANKPFMYVLADKDNLDNPYFVGVVKNLTL